MDTGSDLGETDLQILTFDIPDDALERAAGAVPALTMVNCTNPMLFQCTDRIRWSGNPVLGELAEAPGSMFS